MGTPNQRGLDTVGRRIRTRRLAMKLRLSDVSKETGINPALLSKLERDQMQPHLTNHLRPIARALSASVTSLLPESDRRKPSVTQ